MRKIMIGLIISSILFLGIFTVADKALKAETTGGDPEMLKRLDDVLNNQKAILQAIAEIKQELYIIKIRVTQSQ